jgi:hypothetical protein
MVIFSSNTSYFSLYNYGLGHPTLCVNLSDSSGLDHSLGSRVIAVFSKRRCLCRRIEMNAWRDEFSNTLLLKVTAECMVVYFKIFFTFKINSTAL